MYPADSHHTMCERCAYVLLHMAVAVVVKALCQCIQLVLVSRDPIVGQLP